jgi:Xaa-Pro aminopeptidase
MTERQATALLGETLRARGVKDHFHRPIAWFGDRTRFDGMRTYRAYLATDRKLGENDVAILDVSPIVEGYIGDVGYTVTLKPNAEFERAMRVLLELREKLPSWFESERSLGEIWQEVDRELARAGFDNCYRLYPFSVLGHRVKRVRKRSSFGISIPFSHMSWFGLSAYNLFTKHGVLPLLIRRRSKQSKDGTWAIEPHLGAKGFGAKFEEILVVEGGKARWLDDDVPHVRANGLTPRL